jgi:hypothetical protein
MIMENPPSLTANAIVEAAPCQIATFLKTYIAKGFAHARSGKAVLLA